MIQKFSITVGQLEVILDHMPAAVYVSAIDSWELLYMSQEAKKLLFTDWAAEGYTCYQAVGFNAPCPFCKVGQMGRSDFLVREFQSPANGLIYQLKGKIIDWKGRAAYIEYIADITKKKEEERASEAIKSDLLETFSSIPCGLCVYQYNAGLPHFFTTRPFVMSWGIRLSIFRIWPILMRLKKQLIDSGVMGRTYSFNGSYLQDTGAFEEVPYAKL